MIKSGSDRKRWKDRAVNAALFGIAAVFLLHPQGILGRYLSDWYREKSEQRQIAGLWEELQGIGHHYGAANGNIVVEFGDYECPFCREQHRLLKQYETVNDDLTVVYVHFPLRGIHPRAEDASRLAICAQEFGKFTAMHKRLLETDEWIQDGDWRREAQAVGVDNFGELETCMVSERVQNRLDRANEIAAKLDITSTPTWVTLEGLHSGLADIAVLARLAERGSR